MEGFNTNALEYTNEDVVVIYTPSSDTLNYSYAVIKNGIKGETLNINSNVPSTIMISDEGTYSIQVTLYKNNGIVENITSSNYTIDKTSPIINVKNKTYKTIINKNIDILSGVTATDDIDGNITSSITTNLDSIDMSKTGIKTVEYYVYDRAGNYTTDKAYVTVKQDYTNLIRVGQISFILIAFLIFVFLYKYIRSIKLEKRFAKYSINSKTSASTSLFDFIYNKYNGFIERFSKLLSKSSIFKNKGLKYSKYSIAFELNDSDGMKFMARKIFIGFSYVIILFIINLLRSNFINVLEVIIPFILGYYTLDVIYYYKYIKYRKKIENDLLEAITVMNNAFKAGMSIIQAIELVSKELNGPISKEFKKISTELSYGLDIDIAFKRFADRIKISEAVYLTSSLSVLNKTGGNIIKVFESIKKTMYGKKRLETELKSLTSSSRFIMWVLICVPPIFVIFIGTVNIGYFKPLIENLLGITLIGIMLLIYVAYIYIVRRIMKVRM